MKPQEQEDSLQQQFSNLEMEWDSIKQSFSTSNRQNSSTVTAANDSLFRLYDNSPKELMSLLQRGNSPHDRAAIEVIEQRKADFDNGRIVGRRLFEEYEVDDDDDGKSEVSTVSWVGSEKRGEIYDNVNGSVFIECFYKDGKSEVSNEKYGDNSDRVCVDSNENDGVFDDCFDMDGESEVSMNSEKFCEKSDKGCMDSKENGDEWSDIDEKSVASTEFSCIGSGENGENSEKVCMDSDEVFGVFSERFGMDGNKGLSPEFSYMNVGNYGENSDKVCRDSDDHSRVVNEGFDKDGKSEVRTEFTLGKYGEKSAKVCMDLLSSSSHALMKSCSGGFAAGKRMIWGVAMLFAIGIVAFKGQDEQILVPT